MEKYQPPPPEKTAVILEIGSLFSKMGFSGDGVPKKIKYTPQLIRSLILQKGTPTRTEKEVLELEFCLEELIHQFAYLELLIQPNNRAIFFIKNTFYPDILIEALHKVCLNRLFFSKLYCIESNILPLYTTGTFTGIVVDIGYLETRIQPVKFLLRIILKIYDGYPIQKAAVHLNVGGKLLSSKLEEEILENTNKGLKLEELEDIKVKYLILLLKNQKEEYFSNPDNIEKMKQKLETITIRKKPFQISLLTRVIIYEELFGNTNEEEDNIGAAILKALLNTDINCRMKLVQNIVLAGGCSHIPNFAKRLKKQELNTFLDQKAYQSLSQLKDEFAYSNSKLPTTCASWAGGSVLSQLSGLDRFLYTPETKSV